MSLAEEKGARLEQPEERLFELIDEHLSEDNARVVRGFARAYLRRLGSDGSDGIPAQDLLAEVLALFEFACKRDGEPMAGWEPHFATLTTYDKTTGQGFKWYPVFVPCGVDDAGKDTMRKLVHPIGKSKLYMMKDSAAAADAIKAMAEVLISSVLASGQSAVNGSSGFVLPNANQLPPSIVVDDDWLN